jgi:hypothetical protein
LVETICTAAGLDLTHPDPNDPATFGVKLETDQGATLVRTGHASSTIWPTTPPRCSMPRAISFPTANGDDGNLDPLNERGSNAVHRTGVTNPGPPVPGDAAIKAEDAKVDVKVKSICKGC